MLKIELILSVTAVAWAFAFPRVGARCFEKVESAFRLIAKRRTLSVIAVGVLAVVARLAVLPVLPIPAPAIHDEFSYLLMADTFAHGRLANPTPPLWIHFETFHENMIPTYVSKYFPAQGIFLAIGQVVFGHPFWGVLLSSALMCAAICWMLQGWMSQGWALLGGILAVVRLGIFSYWADSYWGGAVAALGGALVLGSLPRIKKHPQAWQAVLFALGIGLLFNTRPYESIFFLFPVAAALIFWLSRQRGAEFVVSVRSFIAPAAVCFFLVAGLMGYYFWRTTGSPFRMPYSVNEQMYSMNSPFPWVPIRVPPEFRHEVLRHFHEGWQLDQFIEFRNHPVFATSWRLLLLWCFFLGPALTIPLALSLSALPYNFKVRDVGADTRFFASVLASLFIGSCLTAYFMQHYWAPAACVFFVLILMAMRFLSALQSPSKIPGRAIIASTIAVCVVLIPIRVLGPRIGIRLTPPVLKTWASASDQLLSRARYAQDLTRLDGRHLVLVAYSPLHNDMSEWVYNGADIEHEKIIWARDMGPAKNQELIDYFKGRRVWLIEPDETPPRLRPYSSLSERKITGAPSFP